VTSAQERGVRQLASLGEFGSARLRALCSALGQSDKATRDALEVFRLVSEPWGRRPLGGTPAWRNDLTDDCTPFEFSLGFEGDKPELRILFESQPELSQASSWHAGLTLQEELRRKNLADTSVFEQVAQLFAPPANSTPRFSLWHSAVLRDKGAFLFKAYLNPAIGGAEQERPLVEEAFRRLGLEQSWGFVRARLNGVSATTTLPYLSVDLEARSTARVKLYLSAKHADSVESLLAGCTNSVPGQARSWLRQLTGHQGDYLSRPILVCFSFRGGTPAPEATVHIPIRSYAPNDEAALQRASDLLPAESARQLHRAMTALAEHPLRETRGVLAYVSLRPVERHLRVTTYLAPGAYSVACDERTSGTRPSVRSSAPSNS